MPYYRSAGCIPPKRHTQHRTPEGGLYSEELMGEEGFSSDSSLLYHVNIPSAVVDVRVWDLPDQTLTPNHPLAPRHFSTHALFDGGASGVDAVTGRRLLLGNGDVRLSYVVADSPSPLYRNAVGDECLYVESGRAQVETLFGDLAVGDGDYVIIPRATTHRVVPSGGPVRIYAIEANSHIGPPKRFLSRYGQFWSTRPTASGTCAGRGSHGSTTARTSTSTSSTAARARAASRGRCTPTRGTRSTSSAGTAASTRTPSTSPTTSRSPAGSTSPRRRTRSSRGTTS